MEKKASKISDKNKLAKINGKISKNDAKIQSHINSAVSYEKQAKDIIKQADKKGYTLNSKPVRRCVNKGSVAAQIMVAGAVGAATMGAGGIMVARVQTVHMQGTKYKAKQSDLYKAAGKNRQAQAGVVNANKNERKALNTLYEREKARGATKKQITNTLESASLHQAYERDRAKRNPNYQKQDTVAAVDAWKKRRQRQINYANRRR